MAKERALLKGGPRDGDLVDVNSEDMFIVVPGEALFAVVREGQDLDTEIEVHRYTFRGHNRDRMPVFIHDRRLG